MSRLLYFCTLYSSKFYPIHLCLGTLDACFSSWSRRHWPLRGFPPHREFFMNPFCIRDKRACKVFMRDVVSIFVALQRLLIWLSKTPPFSSKTPIVSCMKTMKKFWRISFQAHSAGKSRIDAIALFMIFFTVYYGSCHGTSRLQYKASKEETFSRRESLVLAIDDALATCTFITT